VTGRARPLGPAAAGAAALALAVVAGAGAAGAMTDADCDPRRESGHGPCFGLELTFTNPILIAARTADGGRINTAPQHAALTTWRARRIDECAESPDDGEPGDTFCRVEPASPTLDCAAAPGPQRTDTTFGSDQHGFRVCFYEQGQRPWWYQVAYDQAVLEVTTRPSNLRWLVAQRDAGLTRIFTAAGEVGLAADLDGIGGGHVHIDPQSGFRSVGHLLNFITSLHNLRVLPLTRRVDGVNAPPLSVMGPTMRAQYRDFVRKRWDRTALALDARKAAYAQVLADLRAEVQVYTYLSRRMYTPLDAAAAAAAHDQLATLIAALRRPPVPPGLDWSELKQALDEHWPARLERLLTAWSKAAPDRLPAAKLDDALGWIAQADQLESAAKYSAVHAHSALKTIELRSVDPQRSPRDVVAMIRLLAGAIASTGDDQRLELDDDAALALTGTDAEWNGPDGPRRFRARTTTLAAADAEDIARRYRRFVCKADRSRAGRLLKRLRAYAPPEIAEHLASHDTCNLQ
jgi:hypothetical protein